jgi:hypothetical protein
MSTRKRKKQKNTFESNVEIIIETNNNQTAPLQSIFSALQHYATEVAPIIQQATGVQEIQDSLINKMGLLSPGLNTFLSEQISNFQELVPSPAGEMISSANSILGNFLESTYTSDMNKVIQEAVAQSGVWKVQADEFQNILQVTEPYLLTTQAHLAEILKYSALSESYLSNISYPDIGNALVLEDTVSSLMKNSFKEFSDSYSNLFSWLGNTPLELFSIPPVLSKLPAIEYLNGVSVVDSITIDTVVNVRLAEEKNQADKIVSEETEEKLDLLLTKMSPDFLVPLSGARESLKSTNPDRVRHLSTSLRELFTHVLHRLAPDENIQSWSTSPEYYAGGRPTRRARLLYICRTVNRGPFSEFVEKDVDAALVFLNIFQQGTHEVMPNYTDEQLKAMLIRMESLLRYLLEIANID